MPLLIIEDNRDLVQVLSEGFAENGFSVDSAFSGEEGLEKISRGSYGCIILDIMLPGIDGLQVLDTVRSQGNEIPILLLTARDTVGGQVDGLNRGADDYLSKPFDFRELVARVNALLRRTADRQHSVLRCGSLELDPVSRECRIDGKPLSLRRREFDILSCSSETKTRSLPGKSHLLRVAEGIQRFKQRGGRSREIPSGQAAPLWMRHPRGHGAGSGIQDELSEYS